MNKYIVETPMMLGSGKKQSIAAVGTVVELEDEDAQALLSCGAVRKSDEMVAWELAQAQDGVGKTRESAGDMTGADPASPAKK